MTSSFQPFLEVIKVELILENFLVPMIEDYDGSKDPHHHLVAFQTQMLISGGNDVAFVGQEWILEKLEKLGKENIEGLESLRRNTQEGCEEMLPKEECLTSKRKELMLSSMQVPQSLKELGDPYIPLSPKPLILMSHAFPSEPYAPNETSPMRANISKELHVIGLKD
ncbi:hypothetical protein CR513_54250, partial [Mucuna pruriens]